MKTFLPTRYILRFCSILFFALTSWSYAQAQDLVPDALEYAALKDLYQSTGGLNWSNNSNWPTSWPATATSAEFGTWFGVGVYNGDVSSLQLGYNNLTGTIPASLGNLTLLSYVGLNSNNLVGGLPTAALSNAHNLTHLYLDHNQLSGPLPAWSSGNFQYMQYFNLSFNQFSGTVPTSYITFAYLDLLDLAVNQLTDFPYDFAAMTWLKELRLSGNPFPPGPIPSWIGNMSGLHTLLMGGNNFTGPIPASLGNLHNLTYLSLNGNQLTGAIPAALAGCTAMTALDLLGNQLDDMSNDLSGMTKLGYLGLSNNHFHGPIPEWFGNLPSLYQVFLDGNQFTKLPASFSNLSKLTYVYLQNNQFTESLPDVSKMKDLYVFNAENNQFSGAVPPSFSSPNLYLFNVGGNQLSGEFPSITKWTNLVSLSIPGNHFLGAFPSLTGLNALAFLDATSNHFSSFPTSALSLPSIGYLSFENNELTHIDNLDTDIAANTIHPGAGIYLFIDQNQLDFKTIGTLSGLGFPVFPFPQHKISDVKVSFIENNLLRIPSRPFQPTTTTTWYKKSGAGWVDITADNEDSTRNTFLRSGSTLSDEGVYYWSMTDTQFPDVTIESDTIVMYFERDNMVADSVELMVLKDFFESLNGAAWRGKTNWPTTWPTTATSADFATWEGVVVANGDVVGISLNNNNLHGILPSSLSKLIRLNNFYVEGNQLDGAFPSVLFSLPKLQDLNLNSNQFAGSVPSFKQASFNLNSLRLAANLFTGAFPDLSSQTHLGYLNLSNSTFDPGSIPSSLSSLINLTQLYLVDTKRTGTIPDFIGNKMAALVILYMDYNQLSGNIPNSLSQLQGLQTLSLAYNQLKGSIPDSFGILDRLSYINFSHNALTSSVPTQVGDMQALSELIVSYNNLEGPLPNELANCTMLGNVDIRGNKITSLPNLSGLLLGALQLSDNQITGPVPAWISSATSLQVVRLANNQFSGPLPSGFSSLNAIRELTLDHNQITGPMPDISSWSNLYLLDVSYNQLNGDFPEIPAGVFVVDASNNAFTSVPSSTFKTTAPYYLQFENNSITTVRNLATDLSNGSIPMTVQGGFIALRNNYLDFATLSKVKQVPINHNDLPQKYIKDVTSLSVSVGDRFALPSRPLASTTQITWNKKINNVWTDITSTSEDPSKQTFLLQQASTAVEGEYFWSMTDSGFPDVIIQSEPILVNLNRSRLCASMYCDGLGGVGINTQITNGFTLSVNGKIRANGDIKVTPLNEWPDFVFNANYKLPGLLEVERYILANGHLPGIPSTTEVTKEGIELVSINSKLLQKVEELTLYLIELQKEREQLFQASKQLDKDKDQLKRQLKQLTKQQVKKQGN